MTWFSSDVGSFLKNEASREPAVVLLDPPRTGCEPETLKSLITLSPRLVVYVSCHPVTLARDLRLFHDVGYTLESVQPVDMFPQTDHVETVVVLVRGPGL